MKKTLLLIVVLWQCVISHAQTSKYHEFPDSNATWNVQWWSSGLGSCGEYIDSISTGTEIINGLSYHIIYRKAYGTHVDMNHGMVSSCYTTGPAYESEYYAAIREDTAQKKVYVILPDSVTETTLYDFSLKKGDVFKGYITPYYVVAVVSSIDSIAINSTFRKRWNFRDSTVKYNLNIFSVIEGVGSTEGLIERYTGFEYGSNLACFSQNNKTLYPSYDSTSACVVKFHPISILEKNKPENKISIFPNPSNGKFQIKLETLKETTLEVTNVLGSEILKMKDINDVFEIDLTSQPKGIYFVKMSDSKGDFVVKKIVKED